MGCCIALVKGGGMMIYLYSGTPGSGKSLHIAKDVLNKLRFGGNVIATFEVNEKVVGKRKGNFTYIDIDVITPKYLIDYAVKNHKKGKEGQTLLIIDECPKIFNSREYIRSDRMEWIKFFQVHRHFGYNIILVSQNDRLIDRQIRAFVEYDVKHRKLNNYGFIGVILSIFHMPSFIAVTYWYGVREKVGQEVFFYRPKLGKFYDSFAMFKDLTTAKT